MYGASKSHRGRRLSSTAIDVPRAHAPSSVERWYVLILMCLIYAINIADRYVVSTVLEPIRLELRLDDFGVALLTGVPAGAVLCHLRHSDVLARRPFESPQHTGRCR